MEGLHDGKLMYVLWLARRLRGWGWRSGGGLDAGGRMVRKLEERHWGWERGGGD